jgi:hypothetical protein
MQLEKFIAKYKWYCIKAKQIFVKPLDFLPIMNISVFEAVLEISFIKNQAANQVFNDTSALQQCH